MSNRKPTKAKRRRSFNPDEIATLVHQSITRDLDSLQEYATQEELFYATVQKTEFLKKYKSSESDQELLRDLSIGMFHANIQRLRDLDSILRLPGPRISGHRPERRDQILRIARNIINEVLGPLELSEWFNHCRHSGGTTLGLEYEFTSLEAKVTFPLTVTRRLLPLCDLYRAFDKQFDEALLNHNKRNPLGMQEYEIVDGSRTTTVDKDDKKRRIIAIEPTMNMFFQQGLMAILVKRLASLGLDIECLQDAHRTKAWIASITCLLATIDWSSASDNVLRSLVKWLMPSDWFYALDLVRSPLTQINGEWVDLPMISTMGNATTFPIETLIFWAVGVATLAAEKNGASELVPYELFKEVSVFGDDCILPSYIAQEYIEVLHSVGFQVNDKKSFFREFRFRESCGGDYYRGRNVRPFYLKSPTSTRLSALGPWLCTLVNGITKKYIVYFGTLRYVYGKEFYRTIADIMRQYQIKVKLVPPYFPDDAGFKIGSDLNRFRHQYDFDFDKVVVDEHGCHYFSYYTFKYRHTKERGDAIRLWDELRAQRVRGREWPCWGNKEALVITLDKRGKLRYGWKPDEAPVHKDLGGYVVAGGLSVSWALQVKHITTG